MSTVRSRFTYGKLQFEYDQVIEFHYRLSSPFQGPGSTLAIFAVSHLAVINVAIGSRLNFPSSSIPFFIAHHC